MVYCDRRHLNAAEFLGARPETDADAGFAERGYFLMKHRRLVLWLLLLCVSAILAGCGHDDDEEEKKDKTPEIVKGTIPEMIEAIQALEEGTVTLKTSLTNAGLTGDIVAELRFDRPDRAVSLEIAYDRPASGDAAEPVSIKGELLRFKDRKLGLNMELAGEFAEKLTGTIKASEIGIEGWCVFLLPENPWRGLDTSSQAKFLLEVTTKLLDAAGATEENGNTTVSLRATDSYLKLVDVLEEETVRYLESDTCKELVRETISRLEKFDVNAYVNELIEYYKDDAYKCVEELMPEAGVGREYVDNAIDMLRKQDLNKELQEQLAGVRTEDSNFGVNMPEMAKQQFSEMMKEYREMLKAGGEMPLQLQAYSDLSGYCFEFRMPGKEEGTPEHKISLRVDPGNVSLKEPGDGGLASLRLILEPSLLRYVEKSRCSSDAGSLREIMQTVKVLTQTPGYGISAGDVFVLEIADGTVRLTVESTNLSESDKKSVKGFVEEVLDTGEIRLKSEEGKKVQGQIRGTVLNPGEIVWYVNGGSDFYRWVNQLPLGQRFSQENP